MSVLSLLTAHTLTSSNVRNLALLICHLFIGGQFRQGHILYDPNVFEGHLTDVNDSVCPVQVPWQRIDITQPYPMNFAQDTRTDNILQLIFFDSKYLANQINEFKELFTFYRIFILSSTNDVIETKKRISIIDKSSAISNSNALILHYDSEIDSIHIHLASENDEMEKTSDLYMDDQKVVNMLNGENLFDETIGKYDQKRSIVINLSVFFLRTNDTTNLRASIPIAGQIYMANYFLSVLNASYINATCIGFDRLSKHTNRLLKHQHRKHHNELLLQYDSVDIENEVELVNRHTDTFHFNSYLVSSRDDRETATLYPYSSEKVVVIFVYGIDSKRQTNIWMTPGSRHTIIQMIGIFICLAAVVLFSIRKTFKLPRDSVISTFIDTMVAFISGGNLRMQHKYERWFFGILLIAAFFIMSLFTGDLLDCVILVLNQKFTKLQQLAELSSPIYVNSALAANVHLIREVLKREIGPNINFKGVQYPEAAFNTNNSMIYVCKFNSIEAAQAHLTKFDRDFDILEDDLGGIATYYYYQSYIPDRMLERIEKASSSMMENGLYQFFTSFVAFQRKLFEQSYNSKSDEDDMLPLTFEQLIRPLFLVFSLWGISIVIFAIEIMVYKWRNWNPYL